METQHLEGTVLKRLVGHQHIVEDLDLSSDGQYALSASWDKTLRLWHLETGEATKNSQDTLMTSFLLLSPQITDKSSLVPEIEPLNYGTLLVHVNGLLLKLITHPTVTGLLASDSHQTQSRNQLSSLVDGIRE